MASVGGCVESKCGDTSHDTSTDSTPGKPLAFDSNQDIVLVTEETAWPSSVKVIAQDGTEVDMHGLLDTVSCLFQTLKEDAMADDGDPISLDISTTNLAKIDTYLSQLATGNKMTTHSFPLRPFDYKADPRIVPHFSTSFVFPPDVLSNKFNMSTDPTFTLEAATRKFMEKAKYTPFEMDLVATSNLDEAQSFFLAASFVGITHLERLASIPLGVWAFYFPDRPDVLQSYFDIKPELSDEEQATQLAKIREMLDKVYTPKTEE